MGASDANANAPANADGGAASPGRAGGPSRVPPLAAPAWPAEGLLPLRPRGNEASGPDAAYQAGLRGVGTVDTIAPPPMTRTVTSEEGGVALTFSASLQFVRPVRHFLESLCLIAKYSEEESQAVALVTTEILNNSIEHGATGPGDEIRLLLLVRPDYFRCEVRDPGRGGRQFAKQALDIAQRVPSLEDARGRGLYLIRKNMDNLEVSYDEATGTRVVVYKARAR